MELPRHRIASIDWDYPDGASCIQLISYGKFFEARQCENTRDRVTELRPVNKAKDLTSDQTTYLSGVKAANCPIAQLRIGFRDPETGFQYFFLTNNFHPAASIVVEIFKTCWQIELFFTWDKQNLKVKDVLGIFRKAVMTQIWIAIYIYLLLAYLKFASFIGRSMQQILQLLQLSLFDCCELLGLLRGDPPDPPVSHFQTNLRISCMSMGQQ